VALKRDEAIAHLGTVALFKGLSRKELQLVATLVKEQRYPAGTNIVETGTPGHGLYIIQSGAASVLRDGRTIARLKPGDFFGEVAMLDAGTRTATVRADAETVCLTLASWEIKPLLMEHAAITYKMLQEVVRRVREQPQG